MDFRRSAILGEAVLDRAMERYPELTEALLGLDLDSVEADSRGDLCCLLEAAIQQVRLKQKKKWGLKRAPWEALVPKPHRYWGERARADWLDHPYQVRGGMKPVYVSEPYNLSEDGIRHLARLSDKGWDISISAWEAVYYPGHTLRIGIRAAGPPKRPPTVDIADSYLEGKLNGKE